MPKMLLTSPLVKHGSYPIVTRSYQSRGMMATKYASLIPAVLYCLQYGNKAILYTNYRN